MFTKKTLFTIIAILLVWTCTETTQPELHPKHWMDSESHDFHGNQIALKGLDALETCQTCHGETYGGGSSQISCSDCHAGGPSGHPDFWAHIDPNSVDFHAFGFTSETFDEDVAHCLDCHTIYEEENNDITSCYECHQSYPFFE